MFRNWRLKTFLEKENGKTLEKRKLGGITNRSLGRISMLIKQHAYSSRRVRKGEEAGNPSGILCHGNRLRLNRSVFQGGRNDG